MNQKKELFETMPVPKALATLAIPTIVSQLITMIYNLADTFFIGQSDDPYKVAAVSLCFVLFFVMTAIANLFGIGGGSLISRLMGAGRAPEARKVSAVSVYGTILVAAAYGLACRVWMEPILRLLGASDDTIGYASSYVFWVIGFGSIPTTLSMVMAHLLRSEGHAKKASFGLGMGGVLNILLDPLFMFVILPAGNEVTGAALATMVSNICSLCYFVGVFVHLRGKSVLSVHPKHIVPGFSYLSRVFAVGLPAGIGCLLACISNMILNNLTSGYGDIPIAAIGIVKKIDMLPLNVGMGLCQGMMPLVAYNYSSGNYSRMRAVTNCTRAAGMGFAALCVILFECFAGTLVRLFISDVQTVEIGTDFLRICCLAVPFMFCNVQMCNTFQAMGKGPQSLLLASCRQGLINIPLLFVMHAAFGLYGLVWTQAIADLITLGISFIFYRRVIGRLMQQ